jgi:hypothetical protein
MSVDFDWLLTSPADTLAAAVDAALARLTETMHIAQKPEATANDLVAALAAVAAAKDACEKLITRITVDRRWPTVHG